MHATRVQAEQHDAEDHVRTQLLGVLAVWPLIASMALAGMLGAFALNYLTKPVYESRLTFFVSTASATASNALQADEFAQRRINSYVGVVGSDRMAERIITDLEMDATVEEVRGMLRAAADPDTVLLNVAVQDTDRQRAVLVAQSVARNLDAVISGLDNGGKVGQVDLRVISGPTPEPEMVSPRRTLNLGLGVILGLAVGLVVALLRQQLDASIRSVEQLAALVELPNLATLTYERVARRRSASLAADDPRSRRSEAYRQLRTNLRFVNAAKPIGVLVVTSSVESEGKTTVASNLAVAFAQSQVRTLLVDADLRRPRVGTVFGLENAAGLTSILVGDAQFEEVVQSAEPGVLDVLSSGPIPPNPSELLGSASMEAFVESVRASYDMVIIDTPPVTPVTDGVVTSLLADGVLLVVRFGKTGRDRIRKAVQSLDSVGTRPIGTVLTMVPAKASPAGESYYYVAQDGKAG